MSPFTSIECSRCGQMNPASVQTCCNCGIELAPPLDADELRSNAEPSAAGANFSARNPATRNVIVTDRSHSAIAIGKGARASTTEISAGNYHKTEFHISSKHSRFVIPPGHMCSRDLVPTGREELEQPVIIGDYAVTEGRVFSATSLDVGAEATLKGPVYGADAVTLAEECQLGGPIIGSKNVHVGDRCKLLEAEHDAGHARRLIGILAVNDVEIGHDAQLDYVVAGGNVHIGTRCRIGEIRAQEVEVGDDGQVDRIMAASDLTLGSKVTIGQFQIGDRLRLGNSCRFRNMDTIILHGPLSGAVPTVILRGRQVGPEAMFVFDGRHIQPYTGGQVPADAALIITTVMDHRLWRVLAKLTGAPPSLN